MKFMHTDWRPLIIVLWKLLFTAIVKQCRAIPIDNAVTATMVQCSQDAITVNINTKNTFEGRIFVKGMADKADCVKNYATAGAARTNQPSVTFGFGDCNMQRSRTLAPNRGMMQAIVIIVSFHKLFVTKVDKAYRVQCFYMEAEKAVTSQLEVSMITTEDARSTGGMPQCTYTVRRNSRDGPVVRYARIGEAVFHEWECQSDTHRLLVKSCYVDDGQGNRFETVDAKGCAIDAYIMPDITYEQSGVAKAWVEAHVFKYADKPTVFFQCTVQLCNRGEATCDSISPPTCQRAGGIRRRQKRELAIIESNGRPQRRLPNFADDEVDLISNNIAVMDLEDVGPQESDGDAALEDLIPVLSSKPKQEQADGLQPGICMSTTGFGILLALVILVFLIAAIVGCMLCYTRHRSDHKA